MIDSWMARKLDPGFAHTYSNPSDLITSTMKSDPVRSAVSTSLTEGTSVSAAGDIAGGAVRAASAGAFAETAAGTAASAAAPFKKCRRSISAFVVASFLRNSELDTLAMARHLSCGGNFHFISHEMQQMPYGSLLNASSREPRNIGAGGLRLAAVPLQSRNTVPRPR